MLTRIVSGLLLVLLASPAALAEEVTTPGDIDPSKVIERVTGMPERGTSMNRVRERLGDPKRTVDPVGEPPITRWVYARFTVYFEHDRVIHAVKNRDR